jgi:hypothetical protein
MNNEHTPGPWTAEPSLVGFAIMVNDRFVGEIQEHADAKLVAAAPETRRKLVVALAALHEIAGMVEALRGTAAGAMDDPIWQMAHAAIKEKA